MKVKLSSVAEGIEFQRDESRSFLKTSTGEVVLITDEEINAAEIDDDVSAGADWYIDAVKRAKELINNEQDYICLPSKYDFNEYRVIERFILTLPIDEQKEELFIYIKGKGAFSRFRQGLNRFMLQ